jgi:hypothetical protein
MSNHKNRLQQLEKRHGAQIPARIYVYYHDKEKGYSARANGPYFTTLDELATAQGWTPRESDVLLSVVYASQAQADDHVKIFLPDNGRGDATL